MRTREKTKKDTKKEVELAGVEPASSVWKTEALTIVLTPQTGIRTPYQKQIP